MKKSEIKRKITINKFSKKILGKMNDDKILIEQIKKEWSQIEAREKRRETIDKVKEGAKEVARYILAVAAVSGILTIAVVAPNIFSAFGKLGLHRRFYKKSDMEKALRNLKRRKMIQIEKERGSDSFNIKINLEAKNELVDFWWKNFSIDRPLKWDGYWRIVIFDIPKKLDGARDALRKKLKEMGFWQMQKSVFVCPFECEKEINILREIYDIDEHISLITAIKIDRENELKERFELA